MARSRYADFYRADSWCNYSFSTVERVNMAIKIEALTRYPIKGLSGQPLDSVQLQRGQGFPNDRKFGFARPNSGFNPNNPKPLPKTKFYMLARDAKLALLSTAYDEITGVLTIAAPKETGQFDITTTQGQQQASLFLKSYLALPIDETPQLYEASPHRFTDVSVDSVEMMNAVSIINLDSVHQFARSINQEVDPRRFRANIHFSGLPPFCELDMVGRELVAGAVQFKIVRRTKRCPATEVNLATGERNLKVPQLLLQQYDHRDMGVYAEVVKGGTLSAGDEIQFI